MSIAIINPVDFAVSATGLSGVQQLRSPEPKQVAVATGGAVQISIDLGYERFIDTILVGYTNASDGLTMGLYIGGESGFGLFLGGSDPLPTKLVGGRRHYLFQLAEPLSNRYIGLAIGGNPVGLQLGVVAVGLAFKPQHGPEWGLGAGVIDTGAATRRKDGGFGIDLGARAASLQWSLGDLSDTETDDLFAILHDRGETRPALVIDGRETPSALSERVHWCKFTRLEAYERQDAGTTRWSLRTEDWV